MKRFKKVKQNKEQTDAENDGLSGPVKQVMLTTYKAHMRSGEVIRGKIEVDYSGNGKNFIVTYNRQGTRIEQTNFGTYGSEYDTYDDTKKHLKSYKYKTDGSLERTSTYFYNEQGKSLGYVVMNADESLYMRIVEKYDDRGNHIEHIHSHGNPEQNISRTAYTYNEQNKMLSSVQYGKDDEVICTYHIKYDERGNRIEDRRQYTDKTSAKHNQWYTSKYNEHNDCIEAVFYNDDGSVKDVYTYSYEYDAEGKKIVKPRPDYDPFAPKPGETEELEYDTYNNCVKKTTFYNKLPLNILLYEYVYYDDAESKKLHHPLDGMENRKEETTKETPDEDAFEKEDVKWLGEMPNFTGDTFPAARCYMLWFKDVPSVVTYTIPYIEAIALLEELKENMRAKEIHSYQICTRTGYKPRPVRYTLSFDGYPYLLQAVTISGHDDNEFDVPDNIRSLYDGNVYTSHFQLFCPSNSSNKGDYYFEEELNEYIAKCTLEKKPDKPVINMIEVSGNNFVMREHAVDDDFEIRDLDVNYGYGFQKFHNDLMIRFNTSTKGLILFHGDPGTGKTYYIRHLLRSMVANKKVVIYMPPNMVDHLVDPGFMTFLTEEIRQWSEDGNFCVMLIEDAEPLLAKRQEGVRIQGITNLLNMTDGILNDMLNLQVICTFNVGLRKLDSALLRPGRLIARKEFKALSELDANLLAQRIGVKHHFKKPATLGEIYAMKKDQSILIHEVDSDENSSTIIDDLI